MSGLKRTYKYKLNPSNPQKVKLITALNLCRKLYNACLFQRRIAYRDWNTAVSSYDQTKELPALKSEFPEYSEVYSQVLQDVIRRLDKSFKNFFRRVKAGKKPGFPRYKGTDRYDSIVYPQSGFKIIGNRIRISKLGNIKFYNSRPIPVGAEIKTMTVKRDRVGDWFVSFSIILPKPAPEPIKHHDIQKPVGVDVGIARLATLSDGGIIDNKKFVYAGSSRLRSLQKAVSRKKKGSKNRRKAIKKLAKEHRRIQRKRNDYLHKCSRKLVDMYDYIVFENLTINNMTKNHHLARSIMDSAWGQLLRFTTYKAEEAGKLVETVDPKYTTSTCSVCGNRVKISLSVRSLVCPGCKNFIDRDLNASVNILERGLRKLVGWGAPEIKPVEIDTSVHHNLYKLCIA